MKLPLTILIATLIVSRGQETQSSPTKTEATETKPTRSPTLPVAADAAPKRRVRTTSLDALFKLVPIGRTHEGVRYPVMEKGKLTSMVNSARMTRLDEDSIQFEDAILDQRGDEALTFYLQRAIYDRNADLLLSNQPARIESKTYEIEGDSMAFDRKTGQARLDGRVRMIIYESDPKKSAPAPAPISDQTPSPKS